VVPPDDPKLLALLEATRKVAELRTELSEELQRLVAERLEILARLQAITPRINELTKYLHDTDVVTLPPPVDPEPVAAAIADAYTRIFSEDTPLVTIVLGLIAYATNGATSGELIASIQRMGRTVDPNTIHAALHRLKLARKIEPTEDRKGAPYRLTSEGHKDWSARLQLLEMFGGANKKP